MKSRARFGILCIAAVFILAVPAMGLFAQVKEATAAAAKYLAAIQSLQFKAAYDLIAPSDKAVKTLVQFQDENPLVFIKAMRKADKNYFMYTVKDAKVVGEEIQVSVTTRDMVFPDQGDQEFPIGMLYVIVKGEMEKAKQKVDDPDQFLLAFKKMAAQGGTKELPFASVTRVIRMQKVKNVWYVNKGWQEAFVKAQQEEKARQAQMVENQAKSVIDNAKTFPSDFTEAIGKLQALKDKSPESKLISDGLDLLARMQKNMSLIQLEATDREMMGSKIRLTNNSEFAVSFLIMEYTQLDANGNVLKHEDNFQQGMRADDPSIDPQLTNDWCPPGYSGVVSAIYSTPDDPQLVNWAKTEIKLKGVMYHFD
jgi:hypothetical protein